MLVVLDGDLGELLLRGAVLAHVLDACLPEDRGHQARSRDALRRDLAAAAAGAQEAHLAHLLGADGHGHVVGARRDGEVRLAEGGGAGGAGVRDVDHGDARLADLLQDALTDGGVRLVEVAAGDELDVLHFDAGVLEGKQCGLPGQLRHGLLGVAAELDHRHTDDGYVSHVPSFFSPRRSLRSSG